MVMASQSTLNQSIRSNGSIPVCWNLESVFRILSGLWRCGCLAYVEDIETSWTCYVDQEHWLRHSSIAELITLTLHWSNLIGFGQPGDFKAIDWFVHDRCMPIQKECCYLFSLRNFTPFFLVKIVPIISVPNWIITEETKYQKQSVKSSSKQFKLNFNSKYLFWKQFLNHLNLCPPLPLCSRNGSRPQTTYRLSHNCAWSCTQKSALQLLPLVSIVSHNASHPRHLHHRRRRGSNWIITPVHISNNNGHRSHNDNDNTRSFPPIHYHLLECFKRDGDCPWSECTWENVRKSWPNPTEQNMKIPISFPLSYRSYRV